VAIAGERVREVVLVAEALHDQLVARIAQEIAARQDKVRLVLIAGPSSSGKTTFSKRLSVQLLASGLRPFALELDNYFVNRDESPVDKDGQYDFESLRAVDVELFNEDLLRLLEGQEVTLPHYNFRTGTREVGQTVRLRADHMILVEGIHGLNPDLVPNIPADVTYRIYSSPSPSHCCYRLGTVRLLTSKPSGFWLSWSGLSPSYQTWYLMTRSCGSLWGGPSCETFTFLCSSNGFPSSNLPRAGRCSAA
jgi:uridine kinase